MRYQRSKTAMDEVAVFTPATQLNMGAYMRENITEEPNIGLRTRGLLSGVGAYYDDPGLTTVDASNEGPVDAGRVLRMGSLGQDFPMDETPPDYSYDYPMQPAADAALPSTAPGATPASSWNWQAVMDKAPAMLRDLMLASSSADYATQINKINLERAKQGLPALNPDQYAPRVNVGVAPQTMRIAGIGAGTFLAVAIASAFGFAALTKRRRA